MDKSTMLATVLACAGGFVSTAHADVFYGVTSSRLVRMDTAAQTVTTVANIMGGPNALDSFADCEFDDAGNLWGLRQKNGGLFESPVNQALKINLVSGAALLGGDFGSVAMHSLAWGNGAGNFYSVNFTGSFPSLGSGNLVTVNAATGAISSVSGASHGLPGSFRVDALALGPGGTLYGMWNAGNEFMGTIDYKLVRFDTTSGAGTVIGTVSGSRQFNSLRFSASGTAYTVDSATGDVFTVNLSTGQGTLAFAGGSAAVGMTGLALQVPGPASAGMLAIAGLSALRRRR